MVDVIEIVITVVLTGIVIPSIGFFYRRIKTVKMHYAIVWKNTTKLKPQEIMGIRGKPENGFREYFYQRKIIADIKGSIEKQRNLLIIGNPLAGKTRSVFQALVESDSPRDILVPRLQKVEYEKLLIPFHLTKWRKPVVFFDDLNKYFDKENFEYMLGLFQKKDYHIIATCRSGPEYDEVSAMIERNVLEPFDDIITISKINEDETNEILHDVGILRPASFDGNIGSIFVPIDTMRERFKGCSDVEKGLLRSLKCLYNVGLFAEKQVFWLEDTIVVAAKKEEVERKYYEWVKLLDDLQSKGFIDWTGNKIRIEESYLEVIVEDETPSLVTFTDMMKIFENKTEALETIGVKAHYTGIRSLEKGAYQKVAIEAFTKVLSIWTFEKSPYSYAANQSNLGLAYSSLGEVENTAENCKLAIEALLRALQVYNLEKSPMEYAKTQNNLAVSYNTLKDLSCKLAIAACEEAIKVWTLDSFPIKYAQININLAISYSILAEFENGPINCEKSLEASNKALGIYNIEKFPFQYAAAKNVLGVAYKQLGILQDTVVNCKLAIQAYNMALKVFTKERFPENYALVENNIGVAYKTLGYDEDTTINCKLAIESFKRALEVSTIGKFPMMYAEVQNNLGTAYRLLATVEDTKSNCQAAIEVFNLALRVYSINKSAVDYARVQINLGNTYATLATVENKADNCDLAIAAYDRALQVYTKERFPDLYSKFTYKRGLVNDFKGR